MTKDRIPVANRLQAIETILDRNVQLKEGTLVGSHYVRERSLKQFNEPAWRKKEKANWAKVRRERAIEQNGKLS